MAKELAADEPDLKTMLAQSADKITELLMRTDQGITLLQV